MEKSNNEDLQCTSYLCVGVYECDPLDPPKLFMIEA